MARRIRIRPADGATPVAAPAAVSAARLPEPDVVLVPLSRLSGSFRVDMVPATPTRAALLRYAVPAINPVLQRLLAYEHSVVAAARDLTDVAEPLHPMFTFGLLRPISATDTSVDFLYPAGFITLAEARRQLAEGIPASAVAWIGRCVLQLLHGMCLRFGTRHNNITPRSIWINPREHGVIVTGWFLSDTYTAPGPRLGCDAEYRDYMSPLLLGKTPQRCATADVSCLMRTLMHMSPHMFDNARPLYECCRDLDALALVQNSDAGGAAFYQHVLRRWQQARQLAFGSPRFAEFPTVSTDLLSN